MEQHERTAHDRCGGWEERKLEDVRCPHQALANLSFEAMLPPVNAIDWIRTARIVAFLLCFAICLPFGAAAQNHPTWPQNSDWDISPWVTGGLGYEHIESFSDGRVWSAGVTIARVITDEFGPNWLRGTVEYGFNLVPVIVFSKPQKVYGGGFDPIVVRWNVNKRRRFARYLEFVAGGIFTTDDVPPGKTSTFNFDLAVGPGVQIAARERQAVDIGLRFRHYSNAGLGAGNPSFNGLQLQLGYHWFK